MGSLGVEIQTGSWVLMNTPNEYNEYTLYLYLYNESVSVFIGVSVFVGGRRRLCGSNSKLNEKYA